MEEDGKRLKRDSISKCISTDEDIRHCTYYDYRLKKIHLINAEHFYYTQGAFSFSVKIYEHQK